MTASSDPSVAAGRAEPTVDAERTLDAAAAPLQDRQASRRPGGAPPPDTPLDRHLDAADAGRGGAGRVATTVAIVVLSNVAAVVGALLVAHAMGARDRDAAALAVFAGVAAQGPALAVALRRVHRRSLRTLWGRGGGWAAAGRGAVIGFAASATTAAAFLAFGLIEISWRGSAGVDPWVAAALIALTPAAAVAEELLYRGYALQACRRWPRRPPLFAAPSVALFLAAHYTGQGAAFWLHALFLIAFAVVATASVARTGGLAEASGLHVGWNVSAIFVFAAADAPVGLLAVVEGATPAAALAIAPAALFCGYLALAGGRRGPSAVPCDGDQP